MCLRSQSGQPTHSPLAPVNVYRDFIRELVPEEYHQAVFYDNAKALFKLA